MQMTARRRIDRNILWVLASGFALTILLLLGSGYVGIQAMDIVEQRSKALHERQRMSTHLIDEIQGEEAGLSSVFYALVAGPRPVKRVELLDRLGRIEHDVEQTIQTAVRSGDAPRWQGVKSAVEQFITEVRTLLNSPEGHLIPPASLYRTHEALANEMASLVAANFAASVAEDTRDGEMGRQRWAQSLVLLSIALVISIVCAVATVHSAARVFHRMEWQASELSRLSGHVIDTQEQMLHRFSRELHDEFGQTLTAIEANLAVIPRTSPAVESRIEDCVLLVKDAMASVRELSQLLRPSTLDDFGLVPSLQWLAESFSQRNGIEVELDLRFDGRLPGETETHLFRIAQEALTNVARHSGASRVRLSLAPHDDKLVLVVADNGHGLQAPRNAAGIGLISMRERTRAAEGELRIESGNHGLSVVAEVPLYGINQATPNPSLARG
jgi:signal transduction histidine kinase